MRKESGEKNQELRSGYTTGTCATAAATSAARFLLSKQLLKNVSVQLPRGGSLDIPIAYCKAYEQGAEAGVIKDAGDDPDVTHGAMVFVRLYLKLGLGIDFNAGPGVGTVTRPGLSLAVGEPAINIVPRQMIQTHLLMVAKQLGFTGGFNVTIGVEHGDSLAAKTMNARLGVIGGLSILGTTGIVKPFSCSAYIASIHQGIDVAYANGADHILACTGDTSEQVLKKLYPRVEDYALIEVGDFLAAFAKYLPTTGIKRVSFAGGIAKLSKLAFGIFNLHRKDSSVDFSRLAREAAKLGADSALQQKIEKANTVQQVIEWCQQQHIPMAEQICRLAREQLLSKLPDQTRLEIIAVNREGQCLARVQP